MRDTPGRVKAIRLGAIGLMLFACASACQEREMPPRAGPASAVDVTAGNVARSDRDGGTDAGDGGRGAPPTLNAGRTIAALRPNLRGCYDVGLQTDPNMLGSVLETVTVNANGTVASVLPSQIDGLSADVIACFARVLQSAHFPPPGIDGSTLKVPIAFRRGNATVSDAGDLPPYDPDSPRRR